MKLYFSLLTLLIIIGFTTTAQEYREMGNIKYNSSSVIVEKYKIQVGDTLYLGFGSGSNKQFIFCWLRPNALTYDVNNPLQGLPATFANLPLLVKEIKVKKIMGKEYVDVVYTPTTTKLKISIDLYNALTSNEIKGFSKNCELPE